MFKVAKEVNFILEHFVLVFQNYSLYLYFYFGAKIFCLFLNFKLKF